MSLFTGAKADPLAASAQPVMQAALTATRSALSLTGAPNVNNLAMIVIPLSGFAGSTNHPWAGLREREMHYSGSLLKIAAMYAAYDLRSSADELATAGGLTTWPQVEAALRATFDLDIVAHTPTTISGSPLLFPEDKARKPNYAAMLRVGGGADFVVNFTQAQLDAFENMMVQQDNPGATTTIRGLGFPYLAGKIADDGFIDSARNGVWLAGDYSGTGRAARVPCVNDVDTAQGTTARQLGSLMTLLAHAQMVGRLSSREMKALMARAGNFFHQTQPPLWPLDGRFVATHGKVGIGKLKTGQAVFSEALIVLDSPRDLQFVVVYQNVIQNSQTQRQLLEPVARLVEATITAFIP
jgi:hypothetical protein